MKQAFTLIFLLALAIAMTAHGKTSKAPSPDGESKKSIDFDGDVVEGMNRQPLDSLTSTSEGDGSGKKNHLYRRKKKFKQENRELAREILETY